MCIEIYMYYLLLIFIGVTDEPMPPYTALTVIPLIAPLNCIPLGPASFLTSLLVTGVAVSLIIYNRSRVKAFSGHIGPF